MTEDAQTTMKPPIPRFLALGGVGEIGMNAMVFQWEGQRWLIDCGVSFPDEGTGFAELVLPDLGWIEAHADSFAGMILTHGHEDHVGATPYVLKACDMPIYGSPFTLGLVRRKLKEHDLRSVELRALAPGVPVSPPEAPELTFSFLRVTHSIPEAASLVIDTPAGAILHTGDFKIDEEPVDGEHFDREGFRALGDRGVLFMMSDSTNAQVPGRTISESAVARALTEQVAGWPGRVIVVQFASNLHRLRSLEAAAVATGRRLCLLGRSLSKYIEVAEAAGIASIDRSRLISPDHLDAVDPAEVLLVVTGSQAERRATLYKAATGQHPKLTITGQDLVLFSARIIPGHERRVYRLMGALERRGATVRHPKMAPIHTSGHARRDELAEMLRLVRPRFFAPVHGEFAFLRAHQALAEELGVTRQTLLIENGDEFQVDPEGGPEVIAQHNLEVYYLDGRRTGHAGELRFDDRRKMFYNGHVSALVQLESKGRRVAADVELRAVGLYTGQGAWLDRLADELGDAICALGKTASDERIEEMTAMHVRRFFRKALGKKPVVETFVTRSLGSEPGAGAAG